MHHGACKKHFFVLTLTYGIYILNKLVIHRFNRLKIGVRKKEPKKEGGAVLTATPALFLIYLIRHSVSIPPTCSVQLFCSDTSTVLNLTFNEGKTWFFCG